MTQRPTSITVIAWFLTVSGILGGLLRIMSPAMMNNPLAKDLIAGSPIPLSVLQVINGVGNLVCLIAGIGLFKAKGWTRHLIGFWAVVALIVGYVTFPVKGMTLLGFIFWMVILFFLYRPRANEYFKSGSILSETNLTGAPVQYPQLFRNVANIICYLVGGFFVFAVFQISLMHLPGGLAPKYLIMVILSTLAYCFVFIASKINRFLNRNFVAGIVLLSTSGISASWLLIMALSPISNRVMPTQFMDSFDYFTGSITLLVLVGIGIGLTASGRRRSGNASPAENAPQDRLP